jgi:acetylornithine aminotransferase/acetylornithine/N-succinyldiaminopimelate aminotransferase
MNSSQIRELNHKYVIDTYGKQRSLALVSGKGSRVEDADGKAYLDFLSGLAVNSLGHCHPKVVEAIQKQAETLIHVSNLYYIEPQVNLAERLVENSFASKCFFCNSGAEANEAAIKLARKWGATAGSGPGIVTFKDSFHGRTIATITATGQEKFQRCFHPLPEGFKYASFNDLKSVEEALRRLCDERNLLLILDEVQTGMGRTGRLFSYENYDIEPDVITLAKSLGGGIPIGAMLAGPKVADVFQPGDHASTFGGNPLVSAAALAAIGVMTGEGFIKQTHGFIKDVRGLGMLIGVEFDAPAQKVVAGCAERGLIVGTAGERVLRLLPPLTTTRAEIDEALGVIESALKDY